MGNDVISDKILQQLIVCQWSDPALAKALRELKSRRVAEARAGAGAPAAPEGWDKFTNCVIADLRQNLPTQADAQVDADRLQKDAQDWREMQEDQSLDSKPAKPRKMPKRLRKLLKRWRERAQEAGVDSDYIIALLDCSEDLEAAWERDEDSGLPKWARRLIRLWKGRADDLVREGSDIQYVYALLDCSSQLEVAWKERDASHVS